MLLGGPDSDTNTRHLGGGGGQDIPGWKPPGRMQPAVNLRERVPDTRPLQQQPRGLSASTDNCAADAATQAHPTEQRATHGLSLNES